MIKVENLPLYHKPEDNIKLLDPQGICIKKNVQIKKNHNSYDLFVKFYL